MAPPEYPFQVYSSVSASPCTTAIYGGAGTAVVCTDWDSSLSQAVQIDQLFGQVPAYEHHHQQQQQQQQSYYLQQQYTQPAPTCSTPHSVTSSGSNASDVDIFSPVAEGEPLPLPGVVFSDVCSPTSGGRKTFSHPPGRHQKLRSRFSGVGRRRTAPVYPDKSIPIPLVKENRSPLRGKSSDPRAPSPDSDPSQQLVSDATAEFVQLRSVLHSAAAAAARVPLRVELSRGFSRQIEDIESQLLKLQAEKAILLKRAHESSNMVAPSLSTPGVAVLTVCRTGCADIDSPHLEEANHLLSAIGGLQQELDSAIRKLLSFFTGGQAQQSTSTTTTGMVTEYLSRLQDYLPKSTTLTLRQCSVSGIYQVEDSSHVFSLPEEDTDQDAICGLLAAVNDVLKFAQFITLSDSNVKERLDSLLLIARQRASSPELLSPTAGEFREQTDQVKAVLEGNCVVLTVAGEVWQNQHQLASEVITTLTQALHTR